MEANNIDTLADNIRILQNKLINIKLFLGVPMGILMILYFFTFAMLLDRGMNGALYFEMITTVLFFIAFIYLNRLGFWLLKRRFSGHAVFGPIIATLDKDRISADPEKIAGELQLNQQSSS